MYVLSQGCAIISTIFLGLSYFAKSKRNIMLLCVFYCMFYAFHYLFLGAFTGMVMTLISLIRNIWFYIASKKGEDNSIFSLTLFVLVSIFGVIFTYKDLFSIVSMTGNVISTYSVWQSDVFRYRFLAIIVSVCFLIYAVSIGSLFAIITEVFLLVLEIVSVYKYRKEVIL